MRHVTAILLFCVSLAAQQASFEGLASNSVTQQPLAGVHVRLISFTSEGLADAYGAISNRAGHFSIAQMKPGTYLFMPEFRGFVYVQPKHGNIPIPSITLKSGEHVADFKLEMIPRAVIVGRVVDEFGDPLQRVSVEAEPLSRDKTVVMGSLSGQFDGTTDERGMFRISGAPGKYYVKATANQGYSNGPGEIRTDGTVPTEYGPTWHPGVATKDAAAVVEVAPGGESRIDIRMARPAQQRGLTISGVVRNIPDGNTPASVMLQSGEGSNRITGSRSVVTSADGKFVFSRLEPGFYCVSAMYARGDERMQSTMVELKLNGDAAGVELNLVGASDLTGTFEMAGDPPGAPRSEKLTVHLETHGFGFGMSASGEVGSDRAFRIAGVFPGRLRVRVDGLSEPAYIKTIELDGATVKDGVLDLTRSAGGSRIKIVAGRNGAQVSGSVLDKDGEKLSNSLAMVLLIDDPANLDLDSDGGHMGHVTAEGKYSFKGLRPGKYRLLAVDPLNSPRIDEPAVLKKLAEAAEEFEVKEGERVTKDIKVATQENADAKAKL